jgi:hypothetical protein
MIGFVAEAWADIAPSPAPTGRKYIGVYNEVRLGKNLDDYVFFIAHGRGPGPPRYEYTQVTLSTKISTSMPVGGRYQYISLLAVPKASADQIRTDGPGGEWPNDFKIAGLQRIGFGDTATVDNKYPGGSLTRTYTITGFDKDGKIQTTVERDPADPDGEKQSAPEEENKSSSRTETGPGKTRSVVAGIALALSLAVGGFLLVRNRRARVVPTSDSSCNRR